MMASEAVTFLIVPVSPFLSLLNLFFNSHGFEWNFFLLFWVCLPEFCSDVIKFFATYKNADGNILKCIEFKLICGFNCIAARLLQFLQLLAAHHLL